MKPTYSCRRKKVMRRCTTLRMVQRQGVLLVFVQSAERECSPSAVPRFQQGCATTALQRRASKQARGLHTCRHRHRNASASITAECRHDSRLILHQKSQAPQFLTLVRLSAEEVAWSEVAWSEEAAEETRMRQQLWPSDLSAAPRRCMQHPSTTLKR